MKRARMLAVVLGAGLAAVAASAGLIEIQRGKVFLHDGTTNGPVSVGVIVVTEGNSLGCYDPDTGTSYNGDTIRVVLRKSPLSKFETLVCR